MHRRLTVMAAVAAASIIATGCSGTATTPPASAPRPAVRTFDADHPG